MATRSYVAQKIDDCTYIATYVHYDGYPEHMLENLPKDPTGYIVGKAAKSVDKGVFTWFESDDEPSKFTDENFLSHVARESCAEYLYIFKDGQWYYQKL